ncbi:MAG: DUF4214 domain-containing protein [Desulfovibrionales bacterium]|nr:MAG: DUF4214 domain-containing protein [Desulfovibrionales bacterium]
MRRLSFWLVSGFLIMLGLASAEARASMMESLGITVTEVLFFEQPREGVPADQRDFRTVFDQHSTRFISFELRLSHPALGAVTQIPINALYYRQDGSLLGEAPFTMTIQPTWTGTRTANGLGWPEPGAWTPGTYTVRFSEGGREIASASFQITTGRTAEQDSADKMWVNAFYVAYWGRGADPAGLDYWMDVIRNGILDAGQVAENFALSQEAKDMFPYFKAPEIATLGQISAFLQSVYLNLLDRAVPAEDDGIQYWTSELRSGRATPGAVLGHIIYAAMVADGEDWRTIQHKLAVAEHFTRGFVAKGRPWTSADLRRARSFLHWVGAEQGSVDLGKQIVDQLLGQGALMLEPRSATGTVSGAYVNAEGLPGVAFTVSAEGTATFQGADWIGIDLARSEITTDREVRVSVNGQTLDGKGALSAQEQQALADLFSDPAGRAMALAALEAGCLPESEITPRQLAALLAPLQLALKYLHPDRVQRIMDLAGQTSCDYFNAYSHQVPRTALLLSPATPVPAVFGYVPFDEHGAVEASWRSARCPETTSRSRSGTAGITATPDAMLPVPGDLAPHLMRTTRSVLDEPGIQIDIFGTCGSKCRGACGPDCEFTNCGAPLEVWDCIQDERGRNTGFKMHYDLFTCGVHAGCIAHDACYDVENELWGCGSWAAFIRRHHIDWIILNQTPRAIRSCDGKAIYDYGVDQANKWALGLGPFDREWKFAYSNPRPEEFREDPDQPGYLDVDLCPLPAALLDIEVRQPGAGQPHVFDFLVQAQDVRDPRWAEDVEFAEFRWDFGDGGGQQSRTVTVTDRAASLSVSKTYPRWESRTYVFSVELWVRGQKVAEAQRSAVVQTEVEVTIQGSRIIVYELHGGVDALEHAFSALGNPAEAYRYEWDFGDGSAVVSQNPGPGQNSAITHRYQGLTPGQEFRPAVRLLTLDGELLAQDAILIRIDQEEEPLNLFNTLRLDFEGDHVWDWVPGSGWSETETGYPPTVITFRTHPDIFVPIVWSGRRFSLHYKPDPWIWGHEYSINGEVSADGGTILSLVIHFRRWAVDIFDPSKPSGYSEDRIIEFANLNLNELEREVPGFGPYYIRGADIPKYLRRVDWFQNGYQYRTTNFSPSTTIRLSLAMNPSLN